MCFDVTNACRGQGHQARDSSIQISKDASTSDVTFTSLRAPHNGSRPLVPRLLFLLRDSMLVGAPEFRALSRSCVRVLRVIED